MIQLNAMPLLRRNIELNRHDAPSCKFSAHPLNWSDLDAATALWNELGPFSLVVAADTLYGDDCAAAFSALLLHLAKRSARFTIVLAFPSRSGKVRGGSLSI